MNFSKIGKIKYCRYRCNPSKYAKIILKNPKNPPKQIPKMSILNDPKKSYKRKKTQTNPKKRSQIISKKSQKNPNNLKKFSKLSANYMTVANQIATFERQYCNENILH